MNNCKTGKLSYNSKQEAIKTLNLHAKHRVNTLSAYRCRICDKFHLGRRKSGNKKGA
jgi:hypothetical protein